eukprot:gene22677-32136_t
MNLDTVLEVHVPLASVASTSPSSAEKVGSVIDSGAVVVETSNSTSRRHPSLSSSPLNAATTSSQTSTRDGGDSMMKRLLEEQRSFQLQFSQKLHSMQQQQLKQHPPVAENQKLPALLTQKEIRKRSAAASAAALMVHLSPTTTANEKEAVSVAMPTQPTKSPASAPAAVLPPSRERMLNLPTMQPHMGWQHSHSDQQHTVVAALLQRQAGLLHGNGMMQPPLGPMQSMMMNMPGVLGMPQMVPQMGAQPGARLTCHGARTNESSDISGIGNPYIGNPTGNPQLVAGGAGSAQMRSRPGMKRSRDSPGGSSPTQAAKMVGYEELPSYAELAFMALSDVDEEGRCNRLTAAGICAWIEQNLTTRTCIDRSQMPTAWKKSLRDTLERQTLFTQCADEFDDDSRVHNDGEVRWTINKDVQTPNLPASAALDGTKELLHGQIFAAAAVGSGEHQSACDNII